MNYLREYIYLRNKNTSFEEENVTYEEYRQIYYLPVPKGGYAIGMKSGFLNE